MILYSKYGIVEGNVDEILDFIHKTNENFQTSGCNENYYLEEQLKKDKAQQDAITRDCYDGTGKNSGGGTCWKGNDK